MDGLMSDQLHGERLQRLEELETWRERLREILNACHGEEDNWAALACRRHINHLNLLIRQLRSIWSLETECEEDSDPD